MTVLRRGTGRLLALLGLLAAITFGGFVWAAKEKMMVYSSMIEGVVELPGLQQYYHDELPERTPLKIVCNHEVCKGLDLKKFGQAVEITPLEPVERGAAFLRIDNVGEDGDKRKVEFSYPVEGVKGHAVFKNTPEGWELDDSSVYEA